MESSDTVTFNTIKDLYDVDRDRERLLMKAEVKPGAYKAWRKRAEHFAKQRSSYK